MVNLAGSSRRNPLLDHWKLLLIFLVVLGHIIPGHPILFAAIYTFHMPAFIFLLGMNSRPKPSWKSQAEIAVLLAVFQGLYFVTMKATGWPTGRWWTEPAFIMWFYLSVLIWRQALDPLLRTRWPMSLSIFAALVAGLLPVGTDFSGSRTLVFLPFFIAGHLYGRRVAHWAQQASALWIRSGVALVGCGLAFGCSLLVQGHTVLLEGKLSYSAMDFGPLHGLLYRASALLVGAAVSLCFFVAASSPSRWADYGRNTRSIFLLHGLVAIPLVVWMETQPSLGPRLFVVSVATAFLMVTLLSQGFIAQAFEWALQPVAYLFPDRLIAKPRVTVPGSTRR